MEVRKIKPAATIRDGNMKAIVWEIVTKHATTYSVELVSMFKGGDNNWHGGKSFDKGELLRGARLLQLAYDRISELEDVIWF